MDDERERSICQRYSNRIRAYGLCHLRDGAAAEDLVQHVLLVVLEAVREGRVENLDRLDAYVLGTCRNAVMDMRRGNARRRRIAHEAASVMPEGYEPTSTLLDRRRLEQCLNALDARERGVVLATFVDDRSADEIGRSMGLSAGNVRVIRHRALGRLQACMERGGEP